MDMLLLMPGITFIAGMFFIYLLKRYQLKKILDFWGGDNKVKENDKLFFNTTDSILILSFFCGIYFIATYVYQNSLDNINKEVELKHSEEVITKKAEELILILKGDAINLIKNDIGENIEQLIEKNETK